MSGATAAGAPRKADAPATPENAIRALDAEALGRALVNAGELSENDWRVVAEVARRQSGSPVRALLDLGLMGEPALADRLASIWRAERWRPAEEQGAPSGLVPLEFMRATGILVLEPRGAADGAADTARAGVRIVVSDPTAHHEIEALRVRLGALPRPLVGTRKEIEHFLGEDSTAPGPGGAATAETPDVAGEISALRDMASEAPVVRFLNQTVERAMDLGASDIHFERFDRRFSLRFRVDGLLIDQPPPGAGLFEPILCRLKIMSGLDIAERRRAQDGRIRMRLRGRNLDLRVSLVPTVYGQDAAIRLQDRHRLAEVSLHDLGFPADQERALMSAAGKSHGILLITGPTGSGKTTTLYALLRRMASSARKIVTVEDPVEYAMDGVNQIQVNPAIGLNFASILRNVLRHDPNVILIGEIRDRETAEIAFQASLTGHMVLSTLHTNDVPGAFVRLVDMGVEPYLINAAVEGVAAQRLLRRVCAACRGQDGAKAACRTCGGLGYRGRIGVMEYSRVAPEVKRALVEGADEGRIRGALSIAGYTTMQEEARRLVAGGITDEAEVLRVLGAQAESA